MQDESNDDPRTGMMREDAKSDSFEVRASKPSRLRLVLILVLLAILALVCYCCISSMHRGPAFEHSGILVRVLLATAPADGKLEFSVDGPYKVFPGSTIQPYAASGSLFYGYRLGKGEATRKNPTGLTLNGQPIPHPEMVIVPEEEGTLCQGHREYAGAFHIRTGKNGELQLINALDLESYLAGVLYKEMPSSFPEEALKAQVVAARTYAIFRLQAGTSLLTDDARSQVYGGLSSVTNRARELVQATHGEVLTHDGEIIPAYFSSTCGGITARATDMFLGEAPPPVNHNTACGYCTESPSYAWRTSFTDKEVREKLNLAATVRDFEIGITDSDTARRATEIALLDGRGGILKKMAAKTFRYTMNEGRSLKRSILSTRIDSITRVRDRFIIEGKGWGHGVGLCQYGARGLALKGKNYKQILEYYYKGAEVTADYGGLLGARE